MNTDELDFQLPNELIAQEPMANRSASRLLHYLAADRSIHHRMFTDLSDLLRADDLLVFNNARVTPAKFGLVKPTGGYVEGLYIQTLPSGKWNVMLKNLGPVNPQLVLCFENDPTVTVRVLEKVGDEYIAEVASNEPAHILLDRIGRMPLPPYIRREKHHDDRDDADKARYQTVYAQAPGSVAAPTAGLHFTPDIFAKLDARGIERATVTLHVGLGTFKPVTADKLTDHKMHEEGYTIDEQAATQINRAKESQRRIIAVGTTSARVLESQAANNPIQPHSGATSIFIYPPYEFKWVDAMITNFHLPKSTLIAMIAGLVGIEEQRRIYQEAIKNNYRFFSYGDSSFLDLG